MSIPFNPESHNEYNRLLRKYQDAKQVYEMDDTAENWDRLQEALIRLKRCTDRIFLNGRLYCMQSTGLQNGLIYPCSQGRV